jgi:hypothetical protein
MKSKDNRSLNNAIRAVIAMALAWIVPGAGHAFVGRPWRGVIIFVTIGITFWAGVAMGGVMTVDKQGQKWWFAAEMLTGVHGLVGWQRQEEQVRELEPIIQKEMAQEGASLQNRIQDNRRELNEYHTQVARLKISIQAATDAQERQMLQEDLKTRLEAQKNIEAEVIGLHRQLYNLRSAHTVKVLARKKLALVAPMSTLARAYAGVAGLLNLMCVFDAVMLALIGTVVARPREEQL